MALKDINLFIALTKNFIHCHRVIISKLNFITLTNLVANIHHYTFRVSHNFNVIRFYFIIQELDKQVLLVPLLQVFIKI